MPKRQPIHFQADAKSSFDRASQPTQIDAAPILEFLSLGFGVTWFHERGYRLWMALLKPSLRITEHFGLGMEYVVIGHGFPNDFQQRTLLAEPPSDIQYRVDARIRFVASAAPLMRATCASWAAKTKVVVIPVDASVVGSDHPAERLYEILSTSLWRRDVFDDSEPVTDPAEFFGRQQYVQELATKAFLGQPVALFGLRKIGKSSLLQRVKSLLDVDRTHIVATTMLQCNSTRLKAGHWWTVLNDLINGWATAIETRAAVEQSNVKPRVSKLAELIREKKRLADPASVADAFEWDFGKLLKAARQIAERKGLEDVRLVSVFDEADLLYPQLANAGAWRQEYFYLWNTLQSVKRGLDDPEQFTYILGGVNPSGVESGSLLGEPNPLFEMSLRYLGPLSLRESGDLLTSLGARVGFVFEEGAIARCFELTGGHPWLLRKLGSKLHKAAIDRADRMVLTASYITRIFQRSKREFYAHIDWILNHLRRIAPDEYRLLRDIAVGGRDKYLAEWSDDGFRDTFAEHLYQYGLITFVDERPEISLTLIRDALTLQPASALSEQKKQMREAIDLLEATVRFRIRADVGDTLSEGVNAIVDAIPKEAANRALDRDGLRTIGMDAGLEALVDNLNWGDYLILLAKYHDRISWSGPEMSAAERLEKLKGAFQLLQLVRHNNDVELKRKIGAVGFETLYGSLTAAHELFG
jgi:hypothetical protein